VADEVVGDIADVVSWWLRLTVGARWFNLRRMQLARPGAGRDVVKGDLVERDLQLALIDRIMAHRAAGDTTDLAPEMYSNPINTYVDPARYEAEVERIFRGLPLLACMSADVPSPGDYVTLSITDVPVVVVRGHDGVVRAFRNVCRHRGTCVAEGRGNTARSFMCRFHGWSYRLDGRLINPTHRDGFAGLDRTEFGLSEMACDEVAGIVFVQLDGGPGSLDASDWLSGLAPELAAFGLSEYCYIDTRASTWAVNWKLLFDTFCETYHVRHLHHASIAPHICSEPGLNDAFGPHGRQVAVHRSIAALDCQPRERWKLLPHITLAYLLAPSGIVIYQQDHLEVFQLLPLGPDQTVSVATLYAPEPPLTERAVGHWNRAFDLLLTVIGTEDYIMSEQTQRSFRSGAQRDIVFGRNEPGLIHFHRSIEELLDREQAEVPVDISGRAG
jgi:phenylpropionate dioxygenase-like ring-hydroxylating dioxygenase large terminal subunit